MTTDNPLLNRTGIPAYDQIKAEHVGPAVEKLVTEFDALLAEAEQSTDWETLVKPLGKIDLLFEYGWSPIGHLLGVANSDEMRDAHEKAMPQVVQMGLKAGQSKLLYERYCALRDSDDWAKMSSGQQRIITKAILASEQSGIGLEGDQRARFNEIAERSSQLASDFSNHVLDATKAWHLDITDAADAEGLPMSSDQGGDDSKPDPENGPWRVKLDAPSFGPFMEHCKNRTLREQAYRAYVTRASEGELDNEPLIGEILKLRQEKSQLLGYANYSEVSLANKMAPDKAAIQAMFDELLAASMTAGKEELEQLTKYANENGHDGPLAHWDVSFWAERLREAKYSFTDEELRPYFSLERVMEGMFSLCNRLFGITITAADGKAPVWCDDVRFFEIADESGKHIASFYLDPYSRPENKRGGAWMADCIGRSVTAEETRLPIAHLVCNGTPPAGDTPALMTFREVETLFHEFGHGLQHMLTTVDLRDVAGISGVEWDAVELPSQFMENWCYHRPTLLGMAIHHETGEVLPDELFEKICQARTYRAASQMLRQLLFGMTDIALHSDFDANGESTAFKVYEQIASKTSPMPPFPGNKFLCAFSHIFAGGYAAGYYSYKWAEVLSADAFAAFEEAGLDDESAVAATGRKFRDTVLAEGGSRHPMEVYEAFRGRQPTTEALLRHSGLKS
ncbi:UNVERIFIED_CONTAM: hypothetical protein GTU68_016262 [Idotea baltica]|nr:hypothetical protein [Idotea baltica]